MKAECLSFRMVPAILLFMKEFKLHVYAIKSVHNPYTDEGDCVSDFVFRPWLIFYAISKNDSYKF